MRINHKISFFAGFILGSISLCFFTLYLAQLTSPLWLAHQDAERIFKLENLARDAFHKAKLDDATRIIKSVEVLDENKVTPEKYNEWPMTYPFIPVYLTVGGASYEQFANTKRGGTETLYPCIESYLLRKKGSTTEANLVIAELQKKYPKYDSEHCSLLASSYLNIPGL